MPLYGIVHDSPVITAIQRATRRGRKNLEIQSYIDETQWIDEKILMPIALKILSIFDKSEDKKQEDK